MVERTVRFDEVEYEALREVADEERVPVSYLIRKACADFLDAYVDNKVDML